MKSLIFLLLLLPTFSVVSDKIILEKTVNFFTLAANQEEFSSQAISIRGWIMFYEYSERKLILLFHSHYAMEEFRREEAIEIILPVEDFTASKEYLSSKNVRVYGVYRASPDLGSFGEIRQIRDIDIIHTGT